MNSLFLIIHFLVSPHVLSDTEAKHLELAVQGSLISVKGRPIIVTATVTNRAQRDCYYDYTRELEAFKLSMVDRRSEPLKRTKKGQSMLSPSGLHQPVRLRPGESLTYTYDLAELFDIPVGLNSLEVSKSVDEGSITIHARTITSKL